MPQIRVGIACCFFVLALAACRGVPERVQLNEMENNTGLLYGQIVMPNKEMVMVHIVIHQVGKTFGNMAEDAQRALKGQHRNIFLRQSNDHTIATLTPLFPFKAARFANLIRTWPL